MKRGKISGVCEPCHRAGLTVCPRLLPGFRQAMKAAEPQLKPPRPAHQTPLFGNKHARITNELKTDSL